jgi:hypothetical protein
MIKGSGRFSAGTKRVGRVVSALAILLCSTGLYAQSCALCYTQAASSGSRIIHGLRSGILVLVIPPMCMSVGITILAYRKRNKFNPSPEKDSRRMGW